MTLAVIFDGVGVGEWFVLLAVILIVVGPKRLPSAARKFGNYYSKFRRAADGFKRQLMDMDSDLVREVKDAANEFKSAAEDVESEFSSSVSDMYPPSYGDGTPGDVAAADGASAPEPNAAGSPAAAASPETGPQSASETASAAAAEPPPASATEDAGPAMG